MAHQFPCPNPVCAHAFTADEVQAGAVKCPQCGQVFQFRAGAAPPPSQSRPQPRKASSPALPAVRKAAPVPFDENATLPPDAPAPPVSIPVAQPVAAPVASRSITPTEPAWPAPPAADAGAAASEAESDAPAEDILFDSPLAGNVIGGSQPLVRPLRHRGQVSAKKRYLMIGTGILLGLAALGGGILFVAKNVGRETTGTAKGSQIIGKVRNLKNVDETAYMLTYTESQWASDPEMRQKMGVLTLLKTTESPSPAWLAATAKDFGINRPRDAELLRLGIERLESNFPGTLELAEKPEPAELAGQKGQRLLFKGQTNAVFWYGYMYAIAHHGFGYWLYIAAPTKQESEETLLALQDGNGGFRYHTSRKGWREQPPRTEAFASANGALTLHVPEGLFERHNAQDQDERGELFLFARYQKEKDNRKNSSVLVIALDKAGDLKDAMKASKMYLEEKKKEEGKEYRLAPVADGDPDLGVKEAVGNRPGRIAEYRLMYGEEPQRFWLVAVVNDAGTAYVIRCDCTWDSRQIWREEFQQLLRQAAFKKPAAKADE